MKLIAGWLNGKIGPTSPVCYPCCGHVFFTPVGLGTETDAIVISEESQERADWKANQIVMRVNNHQRLVDQLTEAKEFMEVELTGTAWADCRHMAHSIGKLLAELDAGEGGEV